MSEQPERKDKIIGELPVAARLTFGIERLRLFFTEERLIVARVGKRGAGALAGTSLFGRLGAGLEDALKTGKESLKSAKAEELTPERLLKLDKDNFQIPYDDVVDVEVAVQYPNPTVTILTKDDKLVFTTTIGLDSIRGLFSRVLGEKVRMTRGKQARQ